MKKLINTTLIALSLVTLFASFALASNSTADEYEFTALYNDVEIEFPSEPTKAECDRYSSLQNRVDQILDALEYDVQISEPECAHVDHARQVANDKIESILDELSFEG